MTMYIDNEFEKNDAVSGTWLHFWSGKLESLVIGAVKLAIRLFKSTARIIKDGHVLSDDEGPKSKGPTPTAQTDGPLKSY